MMCSSLVQRTELQLLWQMMVRTQKPLFRSHTLMHLSVPLLTALRELLGLQSTLLTCIAGTLARKKHTLAFPNICDS